MVKMMTAYTTEVDEADDALAEIFSQIDMSALKKNSVGLLVCHMDFVHADFVAKLREKLPFDLIGMTTMASADNHGFDMYALVLTVLTSDDVVFETAATGTLEPGNYRAEIDAAWSAARGKLPGDPAMVIACFPLSNVMSGAELTGAFFDVCKGAPVLGSVAVDVEFKPENCYAFKNSGIVGGSMSMLLMHGPVEPEFIVLSIPKQQIRDNWGMVTDADGCVLKEINGLPAQVYLKNLGIIVMKEAANTTPFMVLYEGSDEPVALGIHTVNDDGSFFCAGSVPKGARVTIGEIKPEKIISTTRECISRILQSGKKNGALFFPCVTRYVMLAPNQGSEMECIAEMMGGSVPYMLAYAAGEVCPVRDGDGRLQNRFHNYTFSACVF